MAVSLREVVSFGRYEPLFRIASGGMAEVYAARIQGEAGFQKMVAVKRMHPHLATDPAFVQMFLDEARLAAHIASPHVVQTLDLGRGTDGSLYIVMELVVGLSLAALLEDHGRLPVAMATEIAAQAAQGLDDAHEATTPAGDELGLVHRDVSPHNLLLGVDGRARVTDFGIAHAIHRPRQETNVKELKGKFAYMSPEQTRLRPLDRRSDVFSVGVVAWEALTGERLFHADDPTVAIHNVRTAPITPPHRAVEGIPPALGAVVMRALERDVGSRWASAADFAQALRRVGREHLPEIPTRKQVGAFVGDAGGEELERLRRLIRLGTEGADDAAIEAVKPGVTRVLAAGDLSGVARLGTGRRRVTEILAADVPSVSVVRLDPDDEPSHTAEVDILSSREISLLLEEDDGAPPPDPEGPTRSWERMPSAIAPPKIPSARPPPPAKEKRPRPFVTPLRAVLVACVILLVAIAIAAALVWPHDEEPVTLPSDDGLGAPPADAPR